MPRMIFHSPRRRYGKHGPPTQAAGTLDQIPTQGAGPHDDTHAHTPQLDRNTYLLQRSLDVPNPTPDDDDATSNDDVDSQVSQHGDDEDDDGDDDAIDDLEPWVDWIKRCTHDVEARLKNSSWMIGLPCRRDGNGGGQAN